VKGNFEFWSTRREPELWQKKWQTSQALNSFSIHNNYLLYLPKTTKTCKICDKASPIHHAGRGDMWGAGGTWLWCNQHQANDVCQSPEEDPKKSNLPLFLLTLPRTEKSQDVFKLTGLCHISIRVET
jgi:hypothetical protein